MLVFGGVNIFCLIEGFPNKKHIQLTIHIPWLLWFTCNWPRPVCSIVEIGAKAWGWNSSHWEWRLEWCAYSGEGFGLKFWSDMVQIFSCSSCSILISWFWWFFETHPVVAGMLSFFFFSKMLWEFRITHAWQRGAAGGQPLMDNIWLTSHGMVKTCCSSIPYQIQTMYHTVFSLYYGYCIVAIYMAIANTIYIYINYDIK